MALALASWTETTEGARYATKKQKCPPHISAQHLFCFGNYAHSMKLET